MLKVGSKAQVWHGTAERTSGGLTKNDLIQNKHGRIVSKKKSLQGKKAIKHLIDAGYIAKKGEFVAFKKKNAKKSKSKSKSKKSRK